MTLVLSVIGLTTQCQALALRMWERADDRRDDLFEL
jgi:hypothetical protein